MVIAGVYKHLAPLEPDHYLVAAQAGLENLWILLSLSNIIKACSIKNPNQIILLGCGGSGSSSR